MSRFRVVRRSRSLIRDVVSNVRHDLLAAVATVLTTAVALCLLGAALLANAQVVAMKDHWYDKVEVSVFLCTDSSSGANCRGELSAADKQELYRQVSGLLGVEAVWYETRDQAWEQFTRRFAGTSVADGVTAASMPESLRVKLVDPTRGDLVESALASTRGVEQVQDQHKILSRFFSLLAKVQAVAATAAVAALLAAAVLITVGVRVAIGHRRREIAIMQLVGAHAKKIRRPFLVAAVLQGLAGGLVAGAATLALKAFMLDGQVSGGTSIAVVSWGQAAWLAAAVAAVGVGISGVVAWVSVRRYLRS